MDPKVKEFIDSAKSKKREEFQKERDAHLISLGLIKEKVRKYSDAYGGGYNAYDEVQKKYYGEFNVPVNVTDEEYAEIKKITEEKSNKEIKIENGAENFLGVLNTIFFVIGIIAAVIFLIIAIDNLGSYRTEDEGIVNLITSIAILIVSFISWGVTRVLLNISNNLHQINSKLK